MAPMLRFKVVLLGEGRVGKTSILLRYTKDEHANQRPREPPWRWRSGRASRRARRAGGLSEVSAKFGREGAPRRRDAAAAARSAQRRRSPAPAARASGRGRSERVGRGVRTGRNRRSAAPPRTRSLDRIPERRNNPRGLKRGARRRRGDGADRLVGTSVRRAAAIRKTRLGDRKKLGSSAGGALAPSSPSSPRRRPSAAASPPPRPSSPSSPRRRPVGRGVTAAPQVLGEAGFDAAGVVPRQAHGRRRPAMHLERLGHGGPGALPRARPHLLPRRGRRDPRVPEAARTTLSARRSRAAATRLLR